MGRSTLISKLQKKVIPKELRKAFPKEINKAYLADKTHNAIQGYLKPEVPETEVPAAPPPESTDEDALRIRDRQRRRARIGSTVRTSSTGALYSGAPKTLLGS